MTVLSVNTERWQVEIFLNKTKLALHFNTTIMIAILIIINIISLLYLFIVLTFFKKFVSNITIVNKQNMGGETKMTLEFVIKSKFL